MPARYRCEAGPTSDPFAVAMFFLPKALPSQDISRSIALASFRILHFLFNKNNIYL